MAVSVVEVARTTTLYSGTTPSATLTTTPAAGDVVVAVYIGGNQAAMSSITGLGATWSAGYTPTSTPSQAFIFAVGTGATTSGAVTMTMAASESCVLHVYLIRGLTSTSISGVYAQSSTNTTVFRTASQVATSGQIVIAAIKNVQTGATTIPSSGTLPSAGAWTAQPTLANAIIGTVDTAAAIPSASGTYALEASVGSTAAWYTAQIVLGPPPAGLQFRNENTFSSTSSLASTAITLGTTPEAGNTLVYHHYSASTAATISSITGCGATWTKVTRVQGTSTGSAEMWVGSGCSGSGNTVTVATTAAAAFVANITEWAGLAGTFGTPATGNANSTAINSGTVTPATVGDLVISMAGDANTGTVTPSDTPTAFTALTSVTPNTSYRNSSAYLVTTSASAAARTWTRSAAAEWEAITTAFPAAAPTGPVTVAAPAVGTTTDVLDPTVSVAAPTVTVAAPVVSTTTDLLDPTISAVTPVTVAAPVLATTSDVLDPNVTTSGAPVTVTAPLLTATTDLLDPSIVGPGTTVTAPLLTTTTAVLAPRVDDGTGVTSLTFAGGGVLDLTDVSDVTPTEITFAGGGAMQVYLPREWQADPRTGRPQYRYLIAHRDGTLYGELANVAADEIEEGVNEPTSFAFTIPANDPGAALVKPIVRECQVWRGGNLIAKGPILPIRGSRNGATLSFDVRDPSWYFSEQRRVIAQIPKRNLLPNGDFLEGLNGWHGGWEADSIPATFPLTSVVDDEYAPGGKALEITGADKSQLIVQETQTGSVFAPNSATYISGGEAIIQGIGANIPNGSTVSLVGHTADDGTGSGLNLSLNRAKAAKATLAAMGKGFTFTLADTSGYKAGQFVTGDSCVGRGYYSPIASNATEAGMAKNRRVTISYQGIQPATGSAQYEHRFIEVTQPANAGVPLSLSLVGLMKILNWIGNNRPGWALYLGVTKVGVPDVTVDEANVGMDEKTPRARWISTEELGVPTVEVPADGQAYRVEVRFYAPAGTIRWTRLRLYPEDGLRFFGVDQANIVKGIVEFMQDPAFGWADLHIGTQTPATGVLRDRQYKFFEQRPVDAALSEFPAMYRGMDVDMLTTKDTATVATFYPQQGTLTDLALEDGGMVVAYEAAASRDVASLIIAQADGSGVARPEEYAIDDAALDGMRLGAIVNAENETPINELDELAALNLARAKRPVTAYWVTIHPKWTSEILDRLGKGDIARLVLPREEVDSPARMVKRVIDPNTDGLRLFMALED